MIWYEFLAPAVAIALGVRLEALLIGPYWSWLEMLRVNGDEGGSRSKERWAAMYRRVAIPGIVGFGLSAILPGRYSLPDVVIVAGGSAGLLLWPILFRGLPYGVTGKRSLLIYGSLVGAFSASGLLGAYTANFARADQGVGKFLVSNVIGVVFGAVLTLFFTGVLTAASRQASEHVYDQDEK